MAVCIEIPSRRAITLLEPLSAMEASTSRSRYPVRAGLVQGLLRCGSTGVEQPFQNVTGQEREATLYQIEEPDI